MKHGLITCDVCGAVGAKTCPFYVDRRLDAAGSMDDEYETMDLCDVHAWKAYLIAEKELGFAIAQKVHSELKALALGMTEKRNAALQRLPK